MVLQHILKNTNTHALSGVILNTCLSFLLQERVCQLIRLSVFMHICVCCLSNHVGLLLSGYLVAFASCFVCICNYVCVCPLISPCLLQFSVLTFSCLFIHYFLRVQIPRRFFLVFTVTFFTAAYFSFSFSTVDNVYGIFVY